MTGRVECFWSQKEWRRAENFFPPFYAEWRTQKGFLFKLRTLFFFCLCESCEKKLINPTDFGRAEEDSENEARDRLCESQVCLHSWSWRQGFCIRIQDPSKRAHSLNDAAIYCVQRDDIRHEQQPEPTPERQRSWDESWDFIRKLYIMLFECSDRSKKKKRKTEKKSSE